MYGICKLLLSVYHLSETAIFRRFSGRLCIDSRSMITFEPVYCPEIFSLISLMISDIK